MLPSKFGKGIADYATSFPIFLPSNISGIMPVSFSSKEENLFVSSMKAYRRVSRPGHFTPEKHGVYLEY
jgi:hypothetical protein